MSPEPSDRATCPHGLTYDATQHIGCVVCRREAGEPSLAPSAPLDVGGHRGATLWIYGGILALVVVVGVGVAARTFLSTTADESAVTPEAAPIRGVAPTDMQPARDRERQQRTWHDEPTPEEDPTQAVSQSERDEALARARQNVAVVVYTTSWCPHCTRAKQYMDENGIRYTERDVEASDSARAERDRLNPRGTIPTFDIEGQTMVGFSAQGLEQRITLVAQSHL